VIVRIATPQDVPQLVELRMRLFAEVGGIQHPDADPALRAATAKYFEQAAFAPHMKSWVGLAEGATVACGTLAEFRRPPYPGNLSGTEAYLLNMYTLPPFRRQGLAGEILKQILLHAKAEGYGKLWLHASGNGRALYERHGFAPNPSEMERAP
jgi:GNAT superfamily N-acetyltransferase